MYPDVKIVLHEAAVLTFNAYSRRGICPPGSPQSDETPVTTAVGFHGPRSGRVELHIWKGALGDLAANMFDQPEPPALKDQLDAACEVVNVIAGNVMRIMDSDSFFEIGIPWISSHSASKEPEPSAEVAYSLGPGEVKVRLFMDN